MDKKRLKGIVSLICICLFIVISFNNIYKEMKQQFNNQINNDTNIVTQDYNSISEYNGKIYTILNNNIPNFKSEDYYKEFELYSDLDFLGRCGTAYANICIETMPKNNEKRESINSIQPTGWKQKKYNGTYLYNRCHLIGYQLSNENANKRNLITGTRYFNVEGMLLFENKVAEYIRSQSKNENRHVLYRVTPDFKENNMVASGVQMEAYSVEDNGKSVCFNVYVYNIQPGVEINYKTGESILK